MSCRGCRQNGSSNSLPLPCQQLLQLRAQQLALQSGQSIQAIETPQLGRVEFGKADLTQLQMQIDSLQAQCNQALGVTAAGGASGRRRPISVEACP